MKQSLPLAGMLAAAALAVGCGTMTDKPVAVVKDGELTVPADYKGWPKFLSEIQRPDAKQVREIYMNTAAKSGSAATGFPNGSVFIMENYAAKVGADGQLEKGADGKLVKGDLLRVFVMGKNKGWGEDVPAEQRNGNWVYASYLASGDKGPENLGTCRACHAPLTQKDFIHRYDEYFSTQKGASISRADVFAALHMPQAVSATESERLAQLAR